MIALKTAFEEDIQSGLKEVIKILEHIDFTQYADHIEILFTYIIKSKKMDKKNILTIMDSLSEKGVKIMKTAVEEFIEEGIEKGKKEGIEEDQRNIVLNMYSKKLSHQKISEYTGIPLTKVKEILQNPDKN